MNLDKLAFKANGFDEFMECSTFFIGPKEMDLLPEITGDYSAVLEEAGFNEEAESAFSFEGTVEEGRNKLLSLGLTER